MYIIFGLFILIGEFFFAFGCEKKSIFVMLIGRVIFGFGGECIGLCLTGIIVKNFNKNEMGLPLGLSISIARIGSVINGVVSPKLSLVKINFFNLIFFYVNQLKLILFLR
jgi:MFS family permease